MICEKCEKEYPPEQLYNCGGCGTVLCAGCLALIIEIQKEHQLDYCSYCWKEKDKSHD
jgi:hypothetical protein